MTVSDLIAIWPNLRDAFAQQGIPLNLSQALALSTVIADLLKGGSSSAPTPPSAIPATLTIGGDANNAPYGVTLAGFSPQDHQGADLRNPANAKYIVYAYLAANKIAPSSAWASVAVPVLSAWLPMVPWRALDGETLTYGDEYVHTAPNGYGMAPGTFNPQAAALEFFWGSWGA